MHPHVVLTPVGYVRSFLTSVDAAPLQGDEGAPSAVLELESAVVDALDGIAVNDELIVLTWLHEARRDVLKVHPRGDAERPLTGVFATRSPHRPNPIGIHTVRVTAILPQGRIEVGALEAIDGTPILDVKPVLSAPLTR